MEKALLGSEPARKHVSYRAKPTRLKRLRQAALERDWSLQRMIDEAVDYYLDADRATQGQPTAEVKFMERMRAWNREAGDADRRRVAMFLGWE